MPRVKVLLQPLVFARVSRRAADFEASGECLVRDMRADEAAAACDYDGAAIGDGGVGYALDGHD